MKNEINDLLDGADFGMIGAKEKNDGKGRFSTYFIYLFDCQVGLVVVNVEVQLMYLGQRVEQVMSLVYLAAEWRFCY